MVVVGGGGKADAKAVCTLYGKAYGCRLSHMGDSDCLLLEARTGTLCAAGCGLRAVWGSSV